MTSFVEVGFGYRGWAWEGPILGQRRVCSAPTFEISYTPPAPLTNPSNKPTSRKTSASYRLRYVHAFENEWVFDEPSRVLWDTKLKMNHKPERRDNR